MLQERGKMIETGVLLMTDVVREVLRCEGVD